MSIVLKASNYNNRIISRGNFLGHPIYRNKFIRLVLLQEDTKVPIEYMHGVFTKLDAISHKTRKFLEGRILQKSNKCMLAKMKCA